MDLLESVAFDGEFLLFSLADGRVMATPLAWFPRLAEASEEQRLSFELSPFGAHWPELGEDVSVVGVLEGASPNRWDASAKNELLCALEGLVDGGFVQEDMSESFTQS